MKNILQYLHEILTLLGDERIKPPYTRGAIFEGPVVGFGGTWADCAVNRSGNATGSSRGWATWLVARPFEISLNFWGYCIGTTLLANHTDLYISGRNCLSMTFPVFA